LIRIIAVVIVAIFSGPLLAETTLPVFSDSNAAMSLGFREQTRPLTVASGKVFELEGMSKLFATESDAWALILNYRVNSLDPDELLENAIEIWPFFLQFVEQHEVTYAAIHAKKYPILNPTKETKFTGFNHVFSLKEDGSWYSTRTGEKVNK